MSQIVNKKISFISRVVLCTVLMTVLSPLAGIVGIVNAATLTGASLTLSDSRISQTSVSYTFDFDNVTTSAIQCISMQFGSTPGAVGGVTGLVTTGAAAGTSDYIPTLGTWTTTGSTGTQYIKATGSAQTPASATDRTVVITGITNGSTSNTAFYVDFKTFNNTDCATSPVDSSTIAFIYTDGQLVTATVDPTLTFAIAGVASGQSVNSATTNVATVTASNAINFGTITSATNKIAAQDVTVATNASTGYTLSVRYTGILTSGANTIDDLNTATVPTPNSTPIAFSAAGVEGFGYTTNDSTLGTGTAARFTTGAPKWAAFTTAPFEVAYSSAAVSNETTRIGFQVGVAATTQPGTYQTTVIYSAVPLY
jgi:hypothetical protein